MILSTSFFSSVPFLSGWLRASDGLIDTRYILIHPTLSTHKYKKEDKYKYKVNGIDEDKDKHKICNVNIFCQHLTRAKQLVLVKTNKEGWKQSIVLHSLWETYETFVVWIRIYCVWSNKSCNSEFSSNCYSLDRQALNMQALYMWVHLLLTFIMSVFVSSF